MKFEPILPPREYKVGLQKQITIRDCGTVHLEPDEQLTFLTRDGNEYDFAAKDWGYYATPSVNGRLKSFGYKTAFVRNTMGKHYVMVVREDKMDSFQTYLDAESQQVVSWLDEQ